MQAQAALLIAAASCSGCSALAQPDRPALLTNPGHATHAELVSTISSALSGLPVTLAEDAFTRSSTLVIEQRPARDASGQRLSGRDFTQPERFELMLSGGRCVLLHAGRRYELRGSECAPASSTR